MSTSTIYYRHPRALFLPGNLLSFPVPALVLPMPLSCPCSWPAYPQSVLVPELSQFRYRPVLDLHNQVLLHVECALVRQANTDMTSKRHPGLPRPRRCLDLNGPRATSNEKVCRYVTSHTNTNAHGLGRTAGERHTEGAYQPKLRWAAPSKWDTRCTSRFS